MRKAVLEFSDQSFSPAPTPGPDPWARAVEGARRRTSRAAARRPADNDIRTSRSRTSMTLVINSRGLQEKLLVLFDTGAAGAKSRRPGGRLVSSLFCRFSQGTS